LEMAKTQEQPRHIMPPPVKEIKAEPELVAGTTVKDEKMEMVKIQEQSELQTLNPEPRTLNFEMVKSQEQSELQTLNPEPRTLNLEMAKTQEQPRHIMPSPVKEIKAEPELVAGTTVKDEKMEMVKTQEQSELQTLNPEPRTLNFEMAKTQEQPRHIMPPPVKEIKAEPELVAGTTVKDEKMEMVKTQEQSELQTLNPEPRTLNLEMAKTQEQPKHIMPAPVKEIKAELELISGTTVKDEKMEMVKIQEQSELQTLNPEPRTLNLEMAKTQEQPKHIMPPPVKEIKAEPELIVGTTVKDEKMEMVKTQEQSELQTLNPEPRILNFEMAKTQEQQKHIMTPPVKEVKAEPELIVGTTVKDEKMEMVKTQEQPELQILNPEPRTLNFEMVKTQEQSELQTLNPEPRTLNLEMAKTQEQSKLFLNPERRTPNPEPRFEELSLISLMQKMELKDIEKMSQFSVSKPQENAFVSIYQAKKGDLLQKVDPTVFQENMNFNKDSRSDDFRSVEKEENSNKGELNLVDNKVKDEPKISIDGHQLDKLRTQKKMFSDSGQRKDLSNRLTNEIDQQNNMVPISHEDIVFKDSRSVKSLNLINLNRDIRFFKVETESSSKLIGESIPREMLYAFIEEASLQLKKGKSEIHIQLKPEYFGKLELRVIEQNGKITAKFVVESVELKKLIESDLDSLKQALLEKGIALEGIEVYVGKEPEKNLEKRHQMYADNIKILPSNAWQGYEEKEVDAHEISVNLNHNGNKLFWFISRIDLIA
ncbi:MAG: flagellar hook-length control protein FliK, partial [Nitrospirota bacterium]